MQASDGHYGTREICEALFGSLHKEKIRTQRALSKKLELENAITEASVLNRADLERVFSELADALQQVVYNSEVDRPSQEDFLNNLANWEVLVEGVARNQSRLSTNGARPEAGVSAEATKRGRGRPKNSHLGNRVARNLA
jgi:hypothetical protein